MSRIENSEAAPHSLDELWFKLRDASPWAVEVENGLVQQEWNGDYRLVALTAGQGRLIAGNRVFTLRAGSVYISPPGEVLRAAAEPARRIELYVFRFQALRDGGVACGEPLERPFPRLGEVTPYSSAALTALCKSICVCWGSMDILERFRGQAVFADLLHRLFKEASSGTEQELGAALETVRSYIEQHYETELTVKKLAEMSRISPRHLMRLFMDNYGIGISDYINELKRSEGGAVQSLVRNAASERFGAPRRSS